MVLNPEGLGLEVNGNPICGGTGKVDKYGLSFGMGGRKVGSIAAFPVLWKAKK